MLRQDASLVGIADAPVLPHYLRPVEDMEPDVFGNFALRVGEVIEAIYPDDARSISKKVIEYRVVVQHLDADTMTATGREYAHCIMINPFGGMADKVVWTPRIDKGRDQDDTGSGRGAKVLLLCINGEHNSAVILGGIRDENDQDDVKEAKQRGHSFYAVFNGVSFRVTADGEMSFKRVGATKIDGSLADGVPDDSLSGMSFFKNGSILLGAKNSHSADEVAQRIQIDQPARQIKMHADKGVHVGEATDAWPLFTTYRTAEKQLHDTLLKLLTTLVQLNETMATAMKATAVLHVIPIIGPILAAPALGQISVQMTAVTALINAAIAAIQTFESGAASYESKLNKND